MLPFEFIVEGPPVSHQTRNRARLRHWQQVVKAAAKSRILGNPAPISADVAIVITYYYSDEAPDVDNIIKPIQDALIGLIYVDDRQVVDTRSRKQNVNGSYKIRGISPVLADGFVSCDEFLHIRITEPHLLTSLAP